MSGWMAISLGLLSLMSCYASYCLGQENILRRIKRMREREDRWREWDAENWEDFDD
jgi:heme exporter protein D